MTDEVQNNAIQKTIIDELGLEFVARQKTSFFEDDEAALKRILIETMENSAKGSDARLKKLIDGTVLCRRN